MSTPSGADAGADANAERRGRDPYVRLVRPTLDRLDPRLPRDTPDPLRRAWQDCEAAFERTVQETRIAA
jgi:hypothetical protein